MDYIFELTDSYWAELFANPYIRNPRIEEKKWQATHIAPLQPPILATFLSWGVSAGAGRVRPAAAKVRDRSLFS